MKYPAMAAASVLLLLSAASYTHAESPPAYEEALAIIRAGQWTVQKVQHPRILDVLGRVNVIFEDGNGTRKNLKLSQTNEDVSTLVKGDTVAFTLAPTIKEGDYTFPAFETQGGHKLPNPFILDAGSYLRLERVR